MCTVGEISFGAEFPVFERVFLPQKYDREKEVLFSSQTVRSVSSLAAGTDLCVCA